MPILCLGKRPGIDLARLQAELFARDICVAHVTSYSSTPPGGALRIAIFATHSDEQIDRLIAELAESTWLNSALSYHSRVGRQHPP